MAGQNPVGVEGLAELRKALHEIGGPPLQKKLRTRFKKIADEVAEDARALVPVGKESDRRAGHPGKARASIRSGASGTTAYVAGGRATVPYFGWLMYGGVLKPTGNRRNTIKRTRVPKGRYIPPVVEKKRDHITREAQQAFEDAAREVGFKKT